MHTFWNRNSISINVSLEKYSKKHRDITVLNKEVAKFIIVNRAIQRHEASRKNEVNLYILKLKISQLYYKLRKNSLDTNIYNMILICEKRVYIFSPYIHRNFWKHSQNTYSLWSEKTNVEYSKTLTSYFIFSLLVKHFYHARGNKFFSPLSTLYEGKHGCYKCPI